MVKLELGPGPHKRFPDAIGLDRKAFPGVQIVADLRAGLPCRSACLDRIVAFSVLEHLPDVAAILRECHRALREGGELRIKAPDPSSRSAWDDPTHVRPYTAESFRHFTRDHPKNYYFDFAFREMRQETDVTGTHPLWKHPWVRRLARALPILRLRGAYQTVYILVK